tara:strand:- start:895 stop:1638 length:744 start_codon:yes stop_codon:yes gene_type:complete
MTEMTEMARKIMNIVNSKQQSMEQVLFRIGFDLNECTLRIVITNLMIAGLSDLGPVPDREYSQIANDVYLTAYIASSLALYKQKMQHLIDDLESWVSLHENYLEIMADRYGDKEDDELVALSMVLMLFMDYSDSEPKFAKSYKVISSIPDVSRVFHVMNMIKDKKKELLISSTDSTSKSEPETDPEANPEPEPQPESEPKRRYWRRDSPSGLKLSPKGGLVLDIILYVNGNKEDRHMIRTFHTQSVV